MDNAAIAEWILCRLTDKGRAASTVGDLVEIGERKGARWFWLSLTGVALSLVWRRPLAFLAALYAGMWTFSWFAVAGCSIYSPHCPPGRWWEAVLDALVWTGSTLWAASLYAAIRHGLLDRTTQVTVVWAGLFTAALYFWWQPFVLGLCIAAALLVVSASVAKRSLRKAAFVVMVSAMAWSALRVLALAPGVLYQNWLGRRLHIPIWGGDDVQQHPSLTWVYFSMIVLSFLVATSVWSWLHDWLMRSQKLESEVDA
jgi:hypothetical protein